MHTHKHTKKRSIAQRTTRTLKQKKTEWRLILNADRKIFKTCIWNWFSQSQCYKPNQALPERANSKSGKNNWKAKKNYDALVYYRGSVAKAHNQWLCSEIEPRDERGIENWIFHKTYKKRMAHARARAHTDSSIQHYFLQVIRRLFFP